MVIQNRLVVVVEKATKLLIRRALLIRLLLSPSDSSSMQHATYSTGGKLFKQVFGKNNKILNTDDVISYQAHWAAHRSPKNGLIFAR